MENVHARQVCSEPEATLACSMPGVHIGLPQLQTWPHGCILSAQKASLRPADDVEVELTVSPVKGQPEGARGKQVLGMPTPAIALVPQRTPGVVPQSLSLVHPGTAVDGYVKLKTPS